MAVRVTRSIFNEQETIPYPKVMRLKSTDKLYFFYREKIGLPLEEPARGPEDDNLMKEWVTNWMMDHFEDYTGPIVIENKQYA